MEWTPLPYMEQAMAFAVQRAGCGLMLDPGLRKTSITLAVIDILRYSGEIRKTLVVAPMRVCYTVWPVEARKWDNFHDLSVVNLHPMKSVERAVQIKRDHHVYLINPESLEKVLPLLTPDFDLLVIDESTKFKDTQTKRFKALRKHLYNFKRRMILTGTPVPNGLQDLFGQMFIVDLGDSLGKYVSHFRMEFCRPDASGFGWVLNRGAAENIYKRVDKNLLRMDAIDHLDMPEVINNFLPVELPKALRSGYDRLEKAFVAEMNDTTIAVPNASVVGTKLRQMANGFIYDDSTGTRTAMRLHEEKLDALEELVEEMQGRPLLVAYEFQEDAAMLLERFDGVALPRAIDIGKSKDIGRDVAAFNRGELPLVIAHPASVGHGLNLQEVCHDVCWYGITWNREWYDQFNARVYRSGQPSPFVVFHHIVCSGTKDEDVMQALASKDRTQKAFNNAIKKQRVA
jgi:hypothetical protein